MIVKNNKKSRKKKIFRPKVINNLWTLIKKYFEDDQLAKWKDESYGRVPSPVYDETPLKNKKGGKSKLKEEFDRMKTLMGYKEKTQ